MKTEALQWRHHEVQYAYSQYTIPLERSSASHHHHSRTPPTMPSLCPAPPSP
jgi:hypothetical protein